jgi:ribose-phosphate pyrophosphokinase
VKYGARQLRLVIPYFGYSTMERAIKSGEVVTAKTRAIALCHPTRTRGQSRVHGRSSRRRHTALF